MLRIVCEFTIIFSPLIYGIDNYFEYQRTVNIVKPTTIATGKKLPVVVVSLIYVTTSKILRINYST